MSLFWALLAKNSFLFFALCPIKKGVTRCYFTIQVTPSLPRLMAEA
jgi:hypothetical protein